MRPPDKPPIVPPHYTVEERHERHIETTFGVEPESLTPRSTTPKHFDVRPPELPPRVMLHQPTYEEHDIITRNRHSAELAQEINMPPTDAHSSQDILQQRLLYERQMAEYDEDAERLMAEDDYLRQVIRRREIYTINEATSSVEGRDLFFVQSLPISKTISAGRTRGSMTLSEASDVTPRQSQHLEPPGRSANITANVNIRYTQAAPRNHTQSSTRYALTCL